MFFETGTLDLTIPVGVDEAEILEAVEDKLAEILGIHESQIDVFVDETGAVKYTICNFMLFEKNSRSLNLFETQQLLKMLLCSETL